MTKALNRISLLCLTAIMCFGCSTDNPSDNPMAGTAGEAGEAGEGGEAGAGGEAGEGDEQGRAPATRRWRCSRQDRSNQLIYQGCVCRLM